MVISAETSLFVGMLLGGLIAFVAFARVGIEKMMLGMLGLTEEGLENRYSKIVSDFSTKLEEIAKTYSELATLNQSQIEAIAQVLRGEIKSEGRRSFWVSFWVQFGLGFFFFVLGVVATLLAT